MIIQALINYLHTYSSISNVVPAGTEVNTGGGILPYIRVSEKPQYGSGRGNSDNGVTNLVIQVCYPANYQNDLDRFILFELFNLVDRKTLTVTYAVGPPLVSSVLQMWCTEEMSAVLPLKNGYICRERTVILPARWR